MRSLIAPVSRGVVAGLVAGLLLTTVQGLARLWFGVSPPAELIGDRIAPLLSIDQFFGLFGVFGGYNGLKQAGILGGTGGQLVVGIAIAVAVAVALVARRSAQRGYRLLAILTGLLYLAAVAVLWPILGSSYVGFGPGAGLAMTLVTMAVGFGLFGVAVAVVLRLLGRVAAPVQTGEPALVTPAGDPAPTAPPARSGPTSVDRRTVLRSGVGVAGLGLAGLGLAAATGGIGAVLVERATFGYDGKRVSGPRISPLTPNDDFYTVTKNVADPRIDAANWSLAVGGAVGSSRSWDLAALRAMSQTTQETTLMCISNGVGDGLESNAMWTGVRLADLITAAGPSGDAVEVLLTAVDGYSDTFSIAKALDPTTLLALRMNGEELPWRHGYPARLVVPGMYGEKNLKWITKVEVVTEDAKGFYESQGWGPNFAVPTRSRFVGVAAGAEFRRADTMLLSGTALGGDRGVSRVEVSVDGGRSWADATITYPGTRLSWALWEYAWQPAAAGAVTLVVRATDGDGAPQITEERPVVPMGATGLHRIDVRVV